MVDEKYALEISQNFASFYEEVTYKTLEKILQKK